MVSGSPTVGGSVAGHQVHFLTLPGEDNDKEGEGIADEAKSKSPKKRKSVTWASESDLTSYFYFEMDETERGVFAVNKLYYSVVSV